MSTYEEGMNGYLAVREAYDKVVSKRLTRRREIMAQLEEACTEQDQRDLEELAAVLHNAYRDGAKKADLRHATRQYGSPKFNELWNAAEFVGEQSNTGPKAEDTSYTRDANNIVFLREDVWNWEGISPENETLMFGVEWSEATGRFLLTWPENSQPHALFNMKNLAKITVLINEREDFNV